MATKIAVVRAAAKTSGLANQSFTAPSGWGTPNFAMFFMSRTDVDSTGATGTDGAVLSKGMTDGTTSVAGCVASQHNVATTNTYSKSKTGAVILEISDADGSVQAEADFNSWVTDGISIQWSNFPSTGWLVTCVLFQFEDVEVGTHDVGTGGTVALSGGYHAEGPNGLVILGCGTDFSYADTLEDGAFLSMGFATRYSSIRQCCAAWSSADGQSFSAPEASVRDDAVYRWDTGAGASQAQLSVTAFSATGFTLDQGSSDFSPVIAYAAFKTDGNVPVWCGVNSTPTGSPAQHSFTGMGLKPIGIIHAATFADTLNSTETAGDAATFSVSAYDGTNQYATTIAEEDNQSPTDNQSLDQDRAIRIPPGTITAGPRESFISFDVGGVTLDATSTSNAARLMATLAIGEPWPIFPVNRPKRIARRKPERRRVVQFVTETVVEVTQLLWMRLQGRRREQPTYRRQVSQGMPYDFGVPLSMAPRRRPAVEPKPRRRGIMAFVGAFGFVLSLPSRARPVAKKATARGRRFVRFIGETAAELTTILRVPFMRRPKTEARRGVRRWGSRVLGEATPTTVGVPTVTLPVRVLPVFAPTHVTVLPVFGSTLPTRVLPVFVNEQATVGPAIGATNATTVAAVFANTHVRIHRVEDMD